MIVLETSCTDHAIVTSSECMLWHFSQVSPPLAPLPLCYDLSHAAGYSCTSQYTVVHHQHEQRVWTCSVGLWWGWDGGRERERDREREREREREEREGKRERKREGERGRERMYTCKRLTLQMKCVVPSVLLVLSMWTTPEFSIWNQQYHSETTDRQTKHTLKKSNVKPSQTINVYVHVHFLFSSVISWAVISPQQWFACGI